MQCLIIGHGSIGKRHASILTQLGCRVSFVSSQQPADYVCFASIKEALQTISVDYVIIANPTYLHYQSLQTLIECCYRGIVLVEKPLFAKNENSLAHEFKQCLVAYNLRFCDLLQQAKKIIGQDKLLTFSAYAGQYLPNWRKNADYRATYSARRNQGGGVLRDLSHELDYSIWFCGPYQRVAAAGGRVSDLAIDSDDAYSIILSCERCPLVSIHLNYLDRVERRNIVMNTSTHSLSIDLVKGTLWVDGVLTAESPDRTQTYWRQHQAILNGDWSACCTEEEGRYVMKLIAAIEQDNTYRAFSTLDHGASLPGRIGR